MFQVPVFRIGNDWKVARRFKNKNRARKASQDIIVLIHSGANVKPVPCVLDPCIVWYVVFVIVRYDEPDSTRY